MIFIYTGMFQFRYLMSKHNLQLNDVSFHEIEHTYLLNPSTRIQTKRESKMVRNLIALFLELHTIIIQTHDIHSRLDLLATIDEKEKERLKKFSFEHKLNSYSVSKSSICKISNRIH